MRRFFIFSFIGVISFVSLFFLMARAASCMLEYGPGTSIPAGYGAAYNIFSTDRELILTLDCQPVQTTFIAGSGKSNQVVYEKAWKYMNTGSNPGWKEITFSNGTRINTGSLWFKGTASTIIPQSLIESGKNYIVAYTCTWGGSSWKCGCSDTACTTHKWQLQSFQAQSAPPPPPPGSTPDLIADTLARTPNEATISVGTPVSFSARVINNGGADAPASQTRLLVDTTAISPDQATRALAKSGDNETKTWTSVWIATLGTHTFKICADSANSVSEGSEETNNCSTSASFIVSGAPPPPPAPAGFWDEGFKQGVVRSELGDIKDITMGSCLYNDAGHCSVDACGACQRGGDTNYSRSNFYSSVSPSPNDSYWVLDHNNDVGVLGGAFSNSCNTGPPNQSFAVGTIGSKSVFSVALEDVATGKRARLVLKNKYNACASAGGTPYLGIGAQKDRGNNGKNIGTFIKGKTGLRVSFTASLNACDRRSDNVESPCLLYLDVITRWNNKPRQFFVYLAHQNHPGTPGGAHVHWNWPNQNSYFYQGSDLAYLNCEEVGVPCLTRGQTKNFSIDVDKLLIRASNMKLYDDKIPEGVEIAIEGIHWSIETAGPSAGMEATVSNITSQKLTY